MKKPYRIALLAVAIVLSLAVSGLVYLRKPRGSPSQLLVDAARKGDTKAIERLLSKGADINGRDEQGYTPLHAAVWYNQTNAVTLLLQKRADVNAPVWGAWTSLMIAARAGNAGIVKALMASGAVNNESNGS